MNARQGCALRSLGSIRRPISNVSANGKEMFLADRYKVGTSRIYPQLRPLPNPLKRKRSSRERIFSNWLQIMIGHLPSCMPKSVKSMQEAKRYMDGRSLWERNQRTQSAKLSSEPAIGISVVRLPTSFCLIKRENTRKRLQLSKP